MASDIQVSFTSFRLRYQLASKPSILTSGSSVKEEQGEQNGRRRVKERGEKKGRRRVREERSRDGGKKESREPRRAEVWLRRLGMRATLRKRRVGRMGLRRRGEQKDEEKEG